MDENPRKNSSGPDIDIARFVKENMAAISETVSALVQERVAIGKADGVIGKELSEEEYLLGVLAVLAYVVDDLGNAAMNVWSGKTPKDRILDA